MFTVLAAIMAVLRALPSWPPHTKFSKLFVCSLPHNSVTKYISAPKFGQFVYFRSLYKLQNISFYFDRD